MHDQQNTGGGQSEAQAEQEIVARPGTRYRITHYILVLIMLGVGIYCIRDGFWTYPQQKRQYEKEGKEYPALNIPFNRVLGIALPVAALAMLCWTLYSSRGSYRLDGQVLYIPGHPPIPLDAIRRIDKRKWDKKGIAYIDYELPETHAAGRLRFDDYLYDREPADRIFEKIEAHVKAMVEEG